MAMALKTATQRLPWAAATTMRRSAKMQKMLFSIGLLAGGLLAGGLLLAGSVAGAQTPALPAPPPTQEQAVVKSDLPAGYVIGIDDLLEVMVANHASLNERLTVLPDGKISLAE